MLNTILKEIDDCFGIHSNPSGDYEVTKIAVQNAKDVAELLFRRAGILPIEVSSADGIVLKYKERLQIELDNDGDSFIFIGTRIQSFNNNKELLDYLRLLY